MLVSERRSHPGPLRSGIREQGACAKASANKAPAARASTAQERLRSQMATSRSTTAWSMTP
ncbi:hypothetical protein ACFWBH_33795 [Streptomyces sp. NPDC059999]|uniref:hypothetical protein n=1 Tax=Streptomyces sp. NPDC059999 TaxID=3347030 RepID=UPI0036BC7498